MRQLTAAILVIITLAGCQLETRTYCWDNSYSLVLPKTMKLVNYLNEQSEYQFVDSVRNFTLFVLRDSKTEYNQMAEGVGRQGFDGYAQILIDILQDNCETLDIREICDTTIHGMRARYTGINMTVDNSEQTYIALCAYEGSGWYYQVYSMCEALQSAHYSKEMARIVMSLKENKE